MGGSRKELMAAFDFELALAVTATFTPSDCTSNAPFASMRRHRDGSVYEHSPSGIGGMHVCSAHRGNRSDWSGDVRGSAIDGAFSACGHRAEILSD
jgi:hypothetical protein